MLKGPDAHRKNGVLINMENNLTVNEREKRRKRNKQQFGLTKEQVKALKLPRAVTQCQVVQPLQLKDITKEKRNKMYITD